MSEKLFKVPFQVVSYRHKYFRAIDALDAKQKLDTELENAHPLEVGVENDNMVVTDAGEEQ